MNRSCFQCVRLWCLCGVRVREGGREGGREGRSEVVSTKSESALCCSKYMCESYHTSIQVFCIMIIKRQP